MKTQMRIMTEKPLNAETAATDLRSWITANKVFFDRNQGAIPRRKVPLGRWNLVIEGLVEHRQKLDFEHLSRMPKAVVANTLECSGNGRALLADRASGNPWTIGGVGNAVWGGIWLRDLLEDVGLKAGARHVAFEGMDKPLGSAGIKFIRSLPLDKALDSTVLAYEMNGEPLPLKHGYPLRALALGWTGANCVKWLRKIVVLDRPVEGFFMDRVYRVFQKGEDPSTGEVVTQLKIKSIITQPLQDEHLPRGAVTVLGAAYAGESDIQAVDVSVDGGKSWEAAELIGPQAPFAWRQWQYLWHASANGRHRLMARATDSRGRQQPLTADWNVLGYGNNGSREHAVTVHII